MTNTGSVLALLLTCASCSWQNTLSHVSSAPVHARFVASTEVHNPPRWVADSSVRFRLAASSTDGQALAAAAQRGLDAVTGFSTGPVITLAVDWQQAERHAMQRPVLYGVLGKTRESLPVHVLDANGGHLHSLQLSIVPALLGEPWYAASRIEASFTELATSLLGG